MLEKIKAIIAEQLSVPELSVYPEKTLADLGADSLDVIEIALLLEDEFDVEIDGEEINEDMTIAELAELIERKAMP